MGQDYVYPDVSVDCRKTAGYDVFLGDAVTFESIVGVGMMNRKAG